MRTAHAARLFLDTRRSRNVSSKTIEAYEWALAKMAALYPLELPSTSGDIEKMFRHYANFAPDSLASLWRRLLTFWRWMAVKGYAENIMQDIPPPTSRLILPRTLNTDETRQLLSCADTSRDYAILAVLLDTGIRVGELASMTRETTRSDGIRVSGKTGDRIVPISPEVLTLVERQGDQGVVWIGLRGPMTVSGLQNIVRRCMRRAGFLPPKLGPHTLRHTFGMQYILNGGDVFSLQRIMGHTKIETTMIYVNMSNALVARQHRKFSPMRNLVCPDDKSGCSLVKLG